MNKTFLFVCTGNTCRSPMAACYFNYAVKAKSLTGYFGDSTGIAACDGMPVSGQSAKILTSQGIFCEHKTKKVSLDLLEKSDRIYAVATNHLLFLQENYPEYSEKIFLLGEGIFDPYGGSEEIYSQVYQMITDAIDRIIGDICRE